MKARQQADRLRRAVLDLVRLLPAALDHRESLLAVLRDVDPALQGLRDAFVAANALQLESEEAWRMEAKARAQETLSAFARRMQEAMPDCAPPLPRSSRKRAAKTQLLGSETKMAILGVSWTVPDIFKIRQRISFAPLNPKTLELAVKTFLEITCEGLFRATLFFSSAGQLIRLEVKGLTNGDSAVFARLESAARAHLRDLQSLGVLSDDDVTARMVEYFASRTDLFDHGAEMGIDSSGRCVLLNG